MKKGLEFLKKHLLGLISAISGIALLIVAGYFGVVFLLGFIQGQVDDIKQEQRDRLVQMSENLERGFGREIRVLQRQLDSTQTVIAGSQVLRDPSFLQRLFNSELNKTRNEILNAIPEAVKREIQVQGQDVESVARVSFKVEGDTIIVPIGTELVQGYWGELIYQPATSEVDHHYRLVLHPIEIDISEVRTQHDPVLGQPITFFTAVDKRTGRELEITSSQVSFFMEKETGFKIDPEPSFGLGLSLSPGATSPTITGSLDWLYYQGRHMDYSFLSLQSNLYTQGDRVKHFTTIGLVSISFK